MRDIRDLIQSYSEAVRESFAELMTVYPYFCMRPLGLTIPRVGELPSGRTYSFHGIGCRFEKDDITVDMDFGPNGRIDGFDAWRLCVFANDIGSNDLTVEVLEESLAELVKAGLIVKSTSGLSGHLYFPSVPDRR